MVAERRILTHERAGRMLAGAAVLACLALAWLLSPWFLLGVAGTALNLVVSAVTDRCAVKSLLIKLGLPGERDLGRAEALVCLSQKAAGDAATAVAPGAETGTRRFGRRLGVTVN
jgi:hypothetical protein